MLIRTYRPDIDGLRAIAILSVLFFHAGFSVVSGGFVGVDIFFVISGYLITKNILCDLSKGSFSFATFYLKRARRILPALLVTLAVSLVVGIIFLSPELLLYLAKASLYATFSISNVLFQSEAGYFDALSQMNPLLHTWSLSVEEQYYLIWPIMIYAVYRFYKVQKLLYLTLSILVVATLLAEYKVIHGEASKAYYWMFYRAGEFAIGALAIWRKGFFLDRLNSSLLQMLGLLLVFYAVFYFNETTPFPGLYALIPCFGAFLIICANNQRGMIYCWLSNRAIVFIGLISYSLYLVHWPLLVFYRYWLDDNLSIGDRYVVIILSFFLACLMYYLVEKPMLKISISNPSIKKKIISGIIFSSLCLTIASIYIEYKKGMPNRISEDFSFVLKGGKEFHREQYGGSGFSQSGVVGKLSNAINVIIVGDSYARQYMYGLDPLLKKKGLSARVFFSGGCVFGKDMTRYEKGSTQQACVNRNKAFFQFVSQHQKIPIILVQNWDMYKDRSGNFEGKVFRFDSDMDYQHYIQDHLHYFHKDIGRDRKLIVIGVQPGSGDPNGVAQCLSRPEYLPQGCLKRFSFREDQGYSYEINHVIDELASRENGIYFINPYWYFCKEGKCNGMNLAQKKIWYSDGYHLSKQGSSHAVKGMQKTLLTLLQGVGDE